MGCQAYSGSKNNQSGIFVMNFELTGEKMSKSSALLELCQSLLAMDSVVSYATGCNWATPSS